MLRKNKRIAFDAIFLTIVGFGLEFGVITWDFSRLTQFTRGDWKLWPQSLGLPAGPGRVQELTDFLNYILTLKSKVASKSNSFQINSLVFHQVI